MRSDNPTNLNNTMKNTKNNQTETASDLSASAGSRRDKYMYDDLADYEETVGYKVNEAFAAGFRMARMKWWPIIDKVEADGGEVVFENK